MSTEREFAYSHTIPIDDAAPVRDIGLAPARPGDPNTYLHLLGEHPGTSTLYALSPAALIALAAHCASALSALPQPEHAIRSTMRKAMTELGRWHAADPPPPATGV